MAFYLPPSGDPGSPEGRLFLHAPYYLAPSGLAAPSRMPVDVAEYYFHALLEASLDLDRAAGSRYATWTRQRASELMADVPEAQRPDSYLGALSDFGAHLLSMRNEVWRLAKRQAAAGRDVCRHLDSPASLFGLWRQSIEQGAYFGSYYLPAGGGVPSQSRRPLTRSDKARFLTEILGVVWAGDPATDFAGLCSSRGSLSSRRLPGAR